jgi:hypothetical protein
MDKINRRYFLLAFGFMWVFLLLILFSSQGKAEGDDSRWVYRTIRQSYWAYDHWTGQTVLRYRYVQKRYPNHTYYLPETRVYSYVRRDDDDRHEDRHRRHQCKDRIRIVGDQHLTVDGAKGAADKAWSQTVRFYHGERFMDVANASGAAYTCSRSSVGETLGQVFNRCELEAKPCAPQRQEPGR